VANSFGKMLVKCEHTCTWWCTLSGVGTFTKEKEVGVEMDQLSEEMEAKRCHCE
jgi:hypothetical protein